MSEESTGNSESKAEEGSLANQNRTVEQHNASASTQTIPSLTTASQGFSGISQLSKQLKSFSSNSRKIIVVIVIIVVAAIGVFGLYQFLLSRTPTAHQVKFLHKISFPSSLSPNYENNVHLLPCLDPCVAPSVTLNFTGSVSTAMNDLTNSLASQGMKKLQSSQDTGSNPYGPSFTDYTIQFNGSPKSSDHCDKLYAQANSGLRWIGLSCQ